MQRWAGHFIVLASLCKLAACTTPETQTIPAFYHWKTQLSLTPTERAYLQNTGATKLYAKFFDVDWEPTLQQAEPLALIEMAPETLPDSLALVPTIFITNRTFLYLPTREVPQLAQQICDKIKALAKVPFEEVQLDCDWSGQTRDKYFQLLKAMRENLGASVKLSATIRLHQIKYPDQTGVPPVDRGMLMFYNMGDVEAWNEANSILNLDVAQQYLDRKTAQYPLPLDVALPMFSWGVLFREGKMIRLINNLTSNDLANDARLHATAPNCFEVLQSGYLNGYYLYAEDALRIETVTPETLSEAASLLKPYLPATASRTVAFYHLDSVLMARFEAPTLQSVLKKLQ